ncbi:MAG: hypothetical protein WBO10_08900 [Pyrinomonadaceae bacterium]
MNSDYLIDKTGSDAEIEGLERLLSEFRYVKTAAPELPATNIIEFAKTPRRRRFGLIFAASASLAFVLLAGVWLRSGGTRINNEIAANAGEPGVEIEIPNTPATEPGPLIQSEIPAIKPETTAAPQQKRQIRPRRSIYRAKKRPADKEKFTAEEKYAYNQLMLALSITSSKLKMVRDKVDGTEITPRRAIDK